MPARPTHECIHREDTQALAANELTNEAQAAAEKHLEECEACRSLFRQLTIDRFPSFRSYTILKEIDRGGFGIIYKAFHHGKARVEALKVLFGQTAMREAYFENEVHAVAQLRHPNIATLHEAHLSTPPPYFAMEFVEGQQLDDYFQSHDVSLEERIEIIKTVARAIDYAHERCVVHRDLKPQNILIDAEGHPRIVDFGISKKLGLSKATDDDEGSSGADEQTPIKDQGSSGKKEGAVGTYGYMAPEQISGGMVDRRADVYGLGALLFHVITGHPARYARQTDRLLNVLRKRKVSRAKDLAAIITKAVHPVPEERYQTCLALVDDLDRYLAGRPVWAIDKQSLGYRVARVGIYVLRTYPRSVFLALVVALATLLSYAFGFLPARWMVAPENAAVETSLIAVVPSTVEAAREGRIGSELPGFDAQNMLSWRVLYGQLLKRLATAEPRIVVFDFYFQRCLPEYDPALLEGMASLGAPVVVGNLRYDVNAEPIGCREILAAAHACGSIDVTRAGYLEREVNVPVAVQRGPNPPIPALALAAYAAARFPDCVADLRIDEPYVEVRYRKREYAAGERRFLDVIDRIPIQPVRPVGEHKSPLEPEDAPAHTLFPLAPVAGWAERAIPLENVLQADVETLRGWFAGRAVMVGHMLERDQHRLRSGEMVYGCQVQTAVLDALLKEAYTQPFRRPWVVIRVCAWCAFAALVASWVRVSVRMPPLAMLIGGLALCILSATAAGYAALEVTNWLAVEGSIGLCSVLCVCGLIIPLRVLREHQLHLTPGSMWPVESTSGTSTVLVSTDRSSAN